MNQELVHKPNPQPKSVLVVDDDLECRYTLAYGLREAGYAVYEAVNASEALRLITSPLSFDAVITDVQMPGEIDGMLLAETIRATLPAVTIVVVSGLDFSETLAASGITFFQKPYRIGLVIEHLDRSLKTK